MLSDKKQGIKIKPMFFRTVDSTNNIAKKTALAGAAEGTAIIAESQTAGRGRLGRSFVSKKGGVYMSIVLRPTLSPADTVFITVAAAVAAARAIESVSHKKCDIKWVNDIYIEGKKVCGILTEGELAADGGLGFAILGVGINLFAPKGGISADLPLADSVFDKKRPFLCKTSLKRRLIKKFTEEFFTFYQKLDKKEFIKEYQERSFLNGREITYTKDGKTYSGIVTKIDENANLIIDGTKRLSQGEIQIVGMEQPPI